MSLPTANELAQRLISLSRMLDAGADELSQADEQFVRAKARYESSRVKAVLIVAAEHRGDKSTLAAEREALVDKTTETEALDLNLAEQKVRSCRERMRVLYSQVEIARSLNAGLRTDAHLAGVGAA
jgi:hypothetical protein